MHGIRSPIAALLLLVGCAPQGPKLWNQEVPLRVRICGDEFRWSILLPGPDGLLETADDLHTWRHLHVPERRRVTLELRSRDYIYSFLLPYLDLVEVAIPRAPVEVVITTGKAGDHDLLGSQMCGFAHAELLGDFFVDSGEDFERWLATLSPAPPAPAQPPEANS
jgi:cytochrome c oxidase subunit 2